ncbi:MAG TPA: zf-HC2 domain-containing protein [Kofleriaceae bacterium]
MICDDARAKLTAYLDGELEGDRGSAIRGHLRGCEMCRNLAADEAALRDGLRALPPLDPPHSLWTNIQHRLAAEEVADSDRPAWRRALARFAARWRPLAPQLALGSAALAVAVFVLALRYRASEQPGTTFAMPALPPIQQSVATAPTTIEGDVTAELAADAARKTASYRQAAEELVSFAVAKRDSWTDDRKAVFDSKLAAFRKDAVAAPTDRARDKIYRQMRSYLQDVAIRDVVTANDRKLAGTRGAP